MEVFLDLKKNQVLERIFLRIRASKEFTFETFKEGIDYAHARGKKVYATINGFPFNVQIELLKNI